MIGTTISHYRITEKLGEGGMGVVYKAEDTKLARPVALKFLAAHLLSNEEAKKRFIREAKAAAALDYPNICTLYEIDEANGRTFMAMAYLEGRTLEAKISEGPLPIEDAIDIATQVAKGLQKAHAKRIYHRDIKPSNLVLVDEGPKERLVKIMDFGLAHLADQSKLTQKDTALGTPAYMSPEQTQGVPVDHRTDIWALGVVLYEMVVAQMPFKGEYQQAIFYTILHEDYEPLTGLRRGVPMDLEFIVSKCLAKDAEQRYQRAEDLIIDLTALREKLAAKKSTTGRKAPATHIAPAPRPEQEAAGAVAAAVGTGTLAGPTELPTQPEPAISANDPELSSPEPSTESQPEPNQPQQSRTPQRAPWLVAGLATATAIAFAILFFALETPPPPRSIVSAILPPEDVRRIEDLALSPDGEWLTFAGLPAEGNARLYLRGLDSPDTRSLDGTEGSSYPFWSPDSRFIGFFADGKLKKIGISGGSPYTLADAPTGRGGTWSTDGVIVFAPNVYGPLHRVSAAGGPVSTVTKLNAEERTHRWPWFLPGGRRFLFLASQTGTPAAAAGTSEIYLGFLDEKPPTLLMRSQANAVYSNGHLLFAHQNTLMAQAFDPEAANLSGEPRPLREPVANSFFSKGGFSISADGRLVYPSESASGISSLTWYDRTGRRLRTVGEPASFRDIAVSPDDGVVAASVNNEAGGANIWLYDLARNLRTRFTFAQQTDSSPTWSLDGKHIAFTSSRGGDFDVFRKTVSGVGEAEPLAANLGLELPRGWSPDGSSLLYVSIGTNTNTGDDLWVLPMTAADDETKPAPTPYLRTEFNERDGQFSPDGRWVAYMSDESGRFEVYVAPFPGATGKVQVSTGGGEYPLWRADGKEIFYRTGDGVIMAADVEADGERFRAGAPRRLFQVSQPSEGGYRRKYDVTADGQKILVIELAESEANPVIMLDSNWPAHLLE